MTRHYIADPQRERPYIELSEEEYIALMGDETTRPYAGKVYSGQMTIDQVPVDLREAVQAVVDARTARFGPYSERRISAEEALNIITGGADA